MTKLVSTKEAALRLGLNDSRVRFMIRTGRLRAKFVGGGYVIDERDLAAFAAKPRATGRPTKDGDAA